MPDEAIREALRHELGGEPEGLFEHFDHIPLASASIGQAHGATLHDGTPVVIKVRSPDAVRQVHEDLESRRTSPRGQVAYWSPHAPTTSDLVVSEKRWRSWEGASMGAGVTVVSSLATYLWTARRHRR